MSVLVLYTTQSCDFDFYPYGGIIGCTPTALSSRNIPAIDSILVRVFSFPCVKTRKLIHPCQSSHGSCDQCQSRKASTASRSDCPSSSAESTHIQHISHLTSFSSFLSCRPTSLLSSLVLLCLSSLQSRCSLTCLPRLHSSHRD